MIYRYCYIHEWSEEVQFTDVAIEDFHFDLLKFKSQYSFGRGRYEHIFYVVVTR